MAVLASAVCSVVALGCASAPGGSAAAPSRPGPADAPSAETQRVAVSDVPEAMIQAALADAARRAPGQVPSLVKAERVTWRDGSLGCPMPGRAYTMALVPGVRIRIRAGADLFDYHAGERGVPFLCPADRATEPLPDDRAR
jgi:hypothetical protein